MVLFLNKKKLQEQKPLANNTYQGKYDYSKMQYLPEDQRFGFDTLVKETGVLPETAYMLGRVESNDSFKPDLIGYNDKSDIGVLQLNENAAVKDISQMRYNDKGEEIGSYWDMIAKRNLKEYEELDLKKAVHSYLGAAAYIRLLKQRLNTQIGKATDEDVLFAYRMGASGYINDIKKGVASDLLKERYKHLVQKGYEPSFTIDKDGKIIKKENKLSLLQRITPTAEAEEIQTERKPIEEIFTEDIERKKFDYQLNEEAERLNKPINIALRTITGIPKQLGITGKEIGQSITRNVASFFSAETLSPIFGKLQDIEKRLEENNITYGFFANEMRDRLLGDLSSDEVVELTGETRGEQVLPAEQRIEKLKNKLKEKADTYREKAKGENGIAKLVHETLADVLSTEGGALGISSTLVLGSIGLDLTGYGGSTKGLTKALTKADNAIDAAKVLMKAGLDEKTALGFASDVVKIKTTKAANSFINSLETTLKTTRPVVTKGVASISDDLAELAAKESPIPKALQKEAKKYKSAEEFVKAQGTPVYHGTALVNAENIDKTGFSLKQQGYSGKPIGASNKGEYISLSKKQSVSELHAIGSTKDGKGGTVLPVFIDKNAKIFSTKDIPKDWVGKNPTLTQLDVYARTHGFDGIDLAKLEDDGIIRGGRIGVKESEVDIFNTDILKTKSQLTDIWNKANKNNADDALINEAKKHKSAEEFVRAREVFGKPLGVSDNLKLIPSKTQDLTLGKSVEYDIELGGKKIGYIELVDRGKFYQSANVEINPQGKGYGTSVYESLIKGLNKPLQSDPGMSEATIALWKGLERKGLAESFTEKAGDFTRTRFRSVIQPKTKSQLTDTWNKAQELKPQTKTLDNILEITPETAKKILTTEKETPIEFGLGKGVMQEKIISNETSKLDDLLNKAKITEEDSIELFNAFDNPKKYALSPSLKSRGGDEIIKEGKKLNKFLSKEKLSRNIIDRIYDDDTYLRTVLETTDGGKPTAEQIARLKNATNQTFRDQLAGDLTGFSGKLREKIKTNARIYRTADERDIVLESFGLRTKRDFVNSMSENLRISTRAISNKEFNDSVRSIAKQGFWVKGGKLVKRDDIIEAYDPINVAKTRQEIRNKTSKKISNILDEIKKERILTENEAKMITNTIYEEKEVVVKELKDSQRYAIDDIDNIINYTKQKILIVKDTLLKEKALLLDKKVKLFEEIREEARRELNNYYGKITIKRGELIDKGFKDAGSINGAEALRGVMLNKKDHAALKEFVTELGESSLEDFAKTIKYFQATLDLFQIPQLIRSSISSSGIIKGSWDWLKAVVKSSGVSLDDMVKSSEFVQQGRFKDFDIDVWNKQIKDLNENTSWFMRLFKKLGKKTDNIPVVRDILKGIGSIDEYQFQTVMIPLKTKAWLRKVDEFKRLYPNMDERSLMVEAGRFIDDYFGGQQWDKLMARNPRLASRQNQRISRIMIFATDYLTSTMRKLKRETFDAFTKWGVPEGNAARKALVREIIFGLGLVNAISYMTRGKSSFENDDPNQFYKIQTGIKDGSGNPYYLDAMGNWGQTWNLINRPIDAIRGKISGIGKIGLSFLADGEIKIGEALNPIPFSWRNIVETIYNHAMGRKPEAQIPETIGGGALLTTMEFMGLAGTFSGGKSRRQTIMRMVESESFTPEEVWKYLTGQNVFTNRERITKMIEKDGINEAYSWEVEQKKKGYLSEESYPTRDALKIKYGISGSITDIENIAKINQMTKREKSIFIRGYSEKTQEVINNKVKDGTSQKSLSDIFK